MINPTKLDSLFETAEFVPQAIIGQPITTIVRRLDVDFERGYDDLDSYEGIGLMLNNELPFALMHYKGHPEDTFTIYLADQIRDVDQITHIIGDIVTELGVSEDQIIWQRKDGIEL